MLTLADLLVPTYRNMLQALRHLIDNAEAQLGPERMSMIGAGCLLG